MTWRAISAWPDPSALIRALGAEVVKQMAAKGEGEAQFSRGCMLVSEADGNAGLMSSRSPLADVGLAIPPLQVTGALTRPMRRCGSLTK